MGKWENRERAGGALGRWSRPILAPPFFQPGGRAGIGLIGSPIGVTNHS